MSKHYQGLVGAGVLATEALLDARDLINDISCLHAMGDLRAGGYRQALRGR